MRDLDRFNRYFYRFVPELQEPSKPRKARMQVIELPDELVQYRVSIRTIIEDPGGRQSISLHHQAKRIILPHFILPCLFLMIAFRLLYTRKTDVHTSVFHPVNPG